MKLNLNKISVILFILGVMLIAILGIIAEINRGTAFKLSEALIIGVVSIFITVSIWAGCWVIVFRLWKKFPWEEYPRKHLIIELFLLTIWCVSVVMGVEHLFIGLLMKILI